MTVSQYLPDDDENPEFLRHKTPLEYTGAVYSDLPARWYRICVKFVPMLIALCDYYTHEDAHEGSESEREFAAQSWRELQIYLMLGEMSKEILLGDENNPFCEEVNACIESGNLTAAISQVISNITYGGDSTTIYATAPVASNNLIHDCDPDIMYGAISQMVDLFYRHILDLLETAVASANWSTRLEYVISAIPFVGSLPVDEMVGFVSVFLEDAYQNYLSSYTESLRQEYICDLFCMAMEDCKIDLYQVARYFAGRFWDDLTEFSWQDLVEYILQGELGGSEYVHATHTVMAFSLAAGSAFLGMSGDFFSALIKSYHNDPDPDWQTLCYGCETGCSVTLNLGDGRFGFVTMPGKVGDWEDSLGFITRGSENTSTIGLGISLTFPENMNITRIRMNISFRWGSSSTATRPHSITAVNGETEKTTSQSIHGQPGQYYVRYVDVFPDITTEKIEILGMAGGSGSDSFVNVRSIQIWFGDDCPDEYEPYRDDNE